MTLFYLHSLITPSLPFHFIFHHVQSVSLLSNLLVDSFFHSDRQKMSLEGKENLRGRQSTALNVLLFSISQHSLLLFYLLLSTVSFIVISLERNYIPYWFSFFFQRIHFLSVPLHFDSWECSISKGRYTHHLMIRPPPPLLPSFLPFLPPFLPTFTSPFLSSTSSHILFTESSLA